MEKMMATKNIEDNSLSLKGIEKYYPVTTPLLNRETARINVLNNIDLDIKREEIFGVIGESGCGKSTLAKLIVNLESPTSGEILFNGENTGDIKKSRKKQFYNKIQMIFQDPFSSLNPRLRVKDIIGEMIRIRGVSKKDEKELVLRILEEIELDETALNKFPHEFSGGQRQRIAIARAIIIKPELLIADEPVSALDLSLQIKILKLLKNLKKKYNLTIMIISHDLTSVSEFCDRVAVMYLGRVVEIINGSDLIKNGKHPYLNALINSIPVSDPRDRGKGKNIIKGEVPTPLNLPKGCTFHPRCEKKSDICVEKIPVLKEIGDNHMVACHLY